MFMPGPSSTATRSATHSSPRATPISCSSSRSHEHASADAVGKQVAGTLAFSPA